MGLFIWGSPGTQAKPGTNQGHRFVRAVNGSILLHAFLATRAAAARGLFPRLTKGSVLGWSAANPHADAEHETTAPEIALRTQGVCRDIRAALAK